MERLGAIWEVSDIVQGFASADLQTARAGLWFNMSGVEGLNAILLSGVGTAGDDPIITLAQAKTVAGGSAKVLNIHRAAYKIGAAGAVFAAAQDLWVPLAIAAGGVASYDSDPIPAAENEFIFAAYILQKDLDVAGGFTHVRLEVADTGSAAQLGSIIYIPAGRRYKGVQYTSSVI